MTEIGYTLSSEEHSPTDLVEHAKRAEEVGFDFLSISDHYHPWIDAQGNAPFAWTALGGVAEGTDDIDVGVGVTPPILRYHPALYAQMAATTAAMFDGRQFFAGVGTGENLNEHIYGDRWPEHEVRLEMLEEAVDVVRKLWTGERVSHHGKHYTVENARLYTLPDEQPPICVSAYGEHAAKSAAEIGDGFWSVGPQDVIETWEEHGGEGPRLCQLHACVAETEEEGISTAHEKWRNSGLPGELSAILPTPTHFEQATQMVSEEDIAEGSIMTGPDAQQHIDSIQEALDAGYDHVYIHQIGDDQEAVFDLYEEEVLPSFS
ncbi:TIGR03557 family F420-dependent LLM class oxidoreductase [Halopelagius longus]|uniref:F420-dependent oxidoreductase, G6PDH family n=1 Tax=Halopelagius longus TaxID=1236180 RepID=A0A1H1FPK0_9EURY|nr:TIGR03557 family F420-dependent LLM class oxidoreductase [Halopelagius longus]RDI70001.1 TIGR03557 family F420-dependent LLM class oxidoreductase [Halopelagius longus]SDR02659.1 F420-dependent oxidoreductase, G6PDH family [Halopelagius longus]